MKPVGIITDSCSGISQKEASERGIFVLPMPFYIEGHCLYEGVDLDRDEFLEKLKEGADVSTSQPSPAEVTALFWGCLILLFLLALCLYAGLAITFLLYKLGHTLLCRIY